MQQMQIADYVNEQPRRSRDANQTERRLCQLLFLSFGMLCIIQVTLNVALRLSWHFNGESTNSNCNTTHKEQYLTECKQGNTGHCNSLQEHFNALTRDKNLLENRNSELRNMIKNVEEERDRLQRRLTVCCSDQSSRTPSSQCPSDWREIDDRCYFLSTELKTWQDSRKYCQNQHSDLVVINSEEEQRALYQLDGDGHLLFWIGLYDTAGTFKWVDGSALTKTFWQSGQPDHGGPNNIEDCVEMYHHNTVLNSWNDAPCGHKLRWLCEKPTEK